MTEPVTVAVLTYDNARTIASCLRSLGNQVQVPAEVLLVDDDSRDDTVALAHDAAAAAGLRLRVVRNGAHNISRGRNLAIDAAETPIVAFLDSDAYAEPGWVAALEAAFAGPDVPAVVGGAVVLASDGPFAEAIAINDEEVRDRFARGTLLVNGCNMAVHRERVGGQRFDEAFVHAEDIEYVHRACGTHPWAVAPDAVVLHESRSNPRGYLRQMYRYGAWKVRYSVRTGDVRAVDFVPTAVLLCGLAAIPLTRWGLVALPALSVLEAAFVIALRRPPRRLLGQMLLGWLVKNTGWGLGIMRGALTPAVR